MIPLSVASCGTDEINKVLGAFNQGWITTTGFHNQAFEEEFCCYLGIDDNLACATSSGTAALHLAYRLLGIGHGDIVWCASLTFVATIAPAVQMGAKPVFIDIDHSYCLDPNLLKSALRDAAINNNLPKAIVVVHVYGQPANMPAIMAIADKYEIPVIEDAAESLGSTCNGQATGTFGAFGIFSFNGNKMITTGGGGMLIAKNKAIAKRAKHLAFQARNPDKYCYSHDELGYNYAMSNVLAGIGRAQLEKIDIFTDKKRYIHDFYRQNLKPVGKTLDCPEYGFSCYWLSVAIAPSYLRKGIMKHLWNNGIDCRPLWLPLHLQPCFAGMNELIHGVSAWSEYAEQTGICLPSSVDLTDYQLTYICDQFKKVVET